MKYKNFERQISESFLQDSAAVDTDALIASLGIPVAVERDRKFAWWMLAGLVLLALMLAGLYYSMSINNDVVSSTKVSKVNIAAQENGNANNINSVSVPLDSDEEVKEINNLSKSNGIIENEKEVNKNAKIVSYINKEERKTTTPIAENDKEQRKEIYSRSNELMTPAQYQSDISAEVAKEVIENNIVATSAEIKDIDNTLTRRLTPISSVVRLNSELESEKEYPGLPDPECPSFSYRIPWNIALLAEVGVMKPMKELQNNNAIVDSAFYLRESNEVSKEAIQIGLHAKVSKGSNPLYVRGGIAYTRIAEQMNESYDYTEQDTMRGLISITTSMTGDTVTAIYGDVISETRFTGRSVKHYYLHLWDLPVAVGYEMPVAGSFYIGGEVGAQFNFRTSGSGLIFRDVNDYADLSEVSTKETKVGMSYFGGLHFGKHLSKRSSIQLSARFRYYPSKFSTLDPNIEQRYNLAGLHAGYVWRF